MSSLLTSPYRNHRTFVRGRRSQLCCRKHKGVQCRFRSCPALTSKPISSNPSMRKTFFLCFIYLGLLFFCLCVCLFVCLFVSNYLIIGVKILGFFLHHFFFYKIIIFIIHVTYQKLSHMYAKKLIFPLHSLNKEDYIQLNL